MTTVIPPTGLRATGPEPPAPAAYPVQLYARLDEPLSRGLWLVKWLLLIPHVVVLVFLFVGYFFVTVFAFFAILFTGHYPRPAFDFTTGVLRWSWRVQYYGYSALGTDRYPPFTLADVPDYPARLTVDYPEHPSRGTALVQWWLLPIPHFLIVTVFLGAQSSWREGHWEQRSTVPGLISVLVILAALALLFTAAYPRELWRLVVGLNRWVFRVVAYVSLMTDRYPPFRLEQGGGDEVAVPRVGGEPFTDGREGEASAGR